MAREHDVVAGRAANRKAVYGKPKGHGQFLLTGGSRLLDMRDLPDTLARTIETIELWPFSQGEIDRTPDGFVDAAFGLGPDCTSTRRARVRSMPSG